MITLLLASILSITPIDTTPFVLEVEVDKTAGVVFIAVYDSEDRFMSDAYFKTSSSVSGTRIQFSLDLPDGEYAISTFQDLNQNRALDSNFLGIPNEPYGFSNNARGQFGPPSYNQCKFNVNNDSKYMVIKLY